MSRVVSLKRVDDDQFHDIHSPDLIILLHHGLTAAHAMIQTLCKGVCVWGGGGGEQMKCIIINSVLILTNSHEHAEDGDNIPEGYKYSKVA